MEGDAKLVGFGPTAADAQDGRLALVGAFSGRIDFGDGEVDSGVDETGVAVARPFIAVFDPTPAGVD